MAYDSSGNRGTSPAVSVTVSNPDFVVSVFPTEQSALLFQKARYVVSVNSTSGFNSSVQMTLQGVVSGMSYKFRNSGFLDKVPGSLKLRITGDETLPLGSYNLTVVVTGGGVTRTFPIVFRLVHSESR